MSLATLTSKGQVTIPIDVREALDLRPQDKLNFTVLPDGTVILRAKKRALEDMAGLLQAPDGVSVTTGEMKAWR
jgi:antitoxin PrlF